MSKDALIECGLRIAVRAVVCDVECYGSRVHLTEPGRWYDTRPMLDPQEHSPCCIDMAAEALHFGEACGALLRHPQQRHLVRVLVDQQPAPND
jgi:hypothetical protein